MNILKYYTVQEISFPFMISALNVTKTAGNGFSHIH